MKFFSVFFFSFYVCSVYSLYTAPPVPSNPVPQLQTSRLPADVQNAYPGTKENIRNRAIPTQHEYRMGPGLPVPDQIAQIASGSKSNPVINPKPNDGGTPHPVLEHIVLTPYLKQIYKTSIPTKRYTVVHPNGTIEHTDEIHTVTARYPSYHMVKSTEIQAHVNRLDMQRRKSENSLSSQSNKSVITTSQNYELASTNSQDSNNIQSQTNSLGNPIESNVNPSNQAYPNDKAQETIVKSPDVPNIVNAVSINSTDSVAYESGVKQNIIDVNKATNEMIEETGNRNQSVTQKLHNNVIAANPLPIYPTTSVSDISSATKVQPSEFPTVNNEVPNSLTVTKGVGDAVAVLDSNSTNLKNEADNQILEIKRTESIKPTIEVQIPIETNQHKALEVILPAILPEGTTGETQTPTTIEGPVRSKIKPEVNIIEEPIATQDDNISAVTDDTSTSPKSANILEPNVVLDVSQSRDLENVKPIDTSKLPTNTTNMTKTVEELQKSDSKAQLQNSTVPNVSNQSPTTLGHGAPLTWFQLSEKSVWDAIRNTSANVYFFFLPPKPKRVKEIRTTVYPNGTTVEQIIETDVYQDEDGIPKPSKNSSIVIN